MNRRIIKLQGPVMLGNLRHDDIFVFVFVLLCFKKATTRDLRQENMSSENKF